MTTTELSDAFCRFGLKKQVPATKGGVAIIVARLHFSVAARGTVSNVWRATDIEIPATMARWPLARFSVCLVAGG